MILMPYDYSINAIKHGLNKFKVIITGIEIITAFVVYFCQQVKVIDITDVLY